MDTDSLKKMTVAQLREEAKKIRGVKGISSMKKDDLVDLLARQSPEPSGAKDAAKPAMGQPDGAPRTLGKSDIKKRIRALKDKKREALSQDDRGRVKYYNRQIHLCKHQLRRLAREKEKPGK